MIEKLLKLKKDEEKKQREFEKKELKELYNLVNKKLDNGVDYLTSRELYKYQIFNIINGIYFRRAYEYFYTRYYFTEVGLKQLESKMIEYGLLDLDDN